MIKEGMDTLDATVTDYAALFEKAMELVTNLQEDLNLQTLNTEVRGLQRKYDEVRETTWSIAPAMPYQITGGKAAPSTSTGSTQERGLAKGQATALVGGGLSSHDYYSR